MNEWEIIGRFVDLDNRLRTLEGRPTVQEKPQPVATGLCEDIEILLKHFDDYFSGVALESFKSRVRHALTAERKRAEIRDILINAVFAWKNNGSPEESEAKLLYAIRDYKSKMAALDAFDKGAENG